MRCISLAIAFGLLVNMLWWTPEPAHADPMQSQSDRVLILMDLSGSMSQKDPSGTIKIEGAKAGVISLLNAIPGTTPVGLMTYPSDGGCGDPKIVRQILPLSEGHLAAVVGGLASPDGNTPTAAALAAAAKLMEEQGGGGTIVLVSDGLANCSADPCDEARKIAASGIQLTVNTVGFDIDAEGRDQLTCIAQATGGNYVDVKKGSDLGKEIANQLAARLDVSTSFPPGTVSVTAVGAVVTASVTNTSGVRANNVKIALTPSGSGGYLGVLRPMVALGNLEPGATRQLMWTVPVSAQLDGRSVELQVNASSDNAARVTKQGTITFGSSVAGIVTSASAFAGAQHVAVLGDSYSSGDGAFQDKSHYIDGNCLRSGKTYADVLFPGKVHSFACSGATTSDVSGGRQQGVDGVTVDAQVDQLRAALHEGEKFDLVFLTIGGNDIGFADIATSCLEGNLVSAAFAKYYSKLLISIPFLNPCAADPNSIVYGAEQQLLQAQGPLLETTYEDIARAFAREGEDVPPIIVSPYPLLSPSDPGLLRGCTAATGVTLAQVGYFLHFQRELDQLIQNTVEQTRRDSGVPVYFADSVESAFQPDRSICSKTSDIVQVSADNLPLFRVHWDTPLHPTIVGHEDWAIALARWSEQPGLTLEKGTKPPGEKLYPWIFRLAPRSTPNARDSVIAAGDTTLTVDNVAPFSPVVVYIHSKTVPIGYARADEHGIATFHVQLDPQVIGVGEHTLVMAVVNPAGEQELRQYRFYLVRPVPYAYWGLLASGVLMILSGLVWLLWRRKTR